MFDGDMVEKNVKCSFLDAPYLTNNNNIIFLANLSNKQMAVFFYDTHKKKLYEIVSTANAIPKLSHFWNISVSKNNFSLRAYSGTSMGIYAYNGNHHFIRLSGLYEQNLPPSNEVDIGGPAYFQVGKKGYVIFHTAVDKQHNLYKRYNLVGNISKDDYSIPLFSTGEPAPYTLDPFYKLGNPTLMYENSIFYIAFQGSTSKLPTEMGAYVMMLAKNASPTSISLVQPGVTFDKSKVVNATLGVVSLRKLKIPVLVKFSSGEYGIYLFTISKDSLQISSVS